MSVIEILKKDRKKYILFQCDQCKKEYEKKYSKHLLDRGSYCSKECYSLSKKKGGNSYEKRKKTFIKKYGVEHQFQADEIKKKCKETMIENYGVNHPSKSQEIQKKIEDTCIKRLGVNRPFKSRSVREKSRQTLLKHYGVDHPSKSKEVQEKIKDTFIKRYGVDNPWKSKEVRDKIQQTCKERFGVDNPLKSNEIRSSFDKRSIQSKKHWTMKKNNSYGKSRIEDRFYEFLCEKYGESNVERNVILNKWNIDFYIKTIDTYIQFDGIYWHGLDRPIEIIKEFKNPRDKTIYKTYLRDKEQNEWSIINKKKLIRITDNEFKI